MTRGMECNNPCNLFTYADIEPWQGEQRPTLDPDGKLCTFDTVVNGLRAGAKQFQIYQTKHGCNTLTLIINRLAPPASTDPEDDNPTDAYIGFVSAGMKVGPDDPIDLMNTAVLTSFLKYQTRFEQGFYCVTCDQIADGIAALTA